MRFKEIKADLFTITDAYFMQCISADFKMGAGIAVEFNKRFNNKLKTCRSFPHYMQYYDKLLRARGDCILTDNVLNLVTKRRFFEKPTYKSMEEALHQAKEICVSKGIKKIALPRIGCGLDKLDWTRVSQTIKDIFSDTDVELIVCTL